MDGVFLGLDYGRKRIGVAISTPLGTVHPRQRLERVGLREDLEALRALAVEVEAEAIVLGLPHNMDGSVSEMEREVRGFAAQLAGACALPIYGSDERLTTESAETILKSREISGRARKRRRDSASACILLQDFLDAGQPRERIA